MCGICGAIDLNGNPIPDLERRLEVMSELIAHRGPDDDGVWAHPRGHVGFAHRRLRIIDLDHGHQPMSDEAGRWHHLQRRGLQLPRAARRDRRRRLPHRLRHRGRPARPRHAGASTALRAPARHVRLRDLGRAEPTSSSAPATASGSSRFYYAQVGDVLYFASEAKALLPFLPSIETDLEGLKDYLAFQFCLAGKTLFKGVRELLPGHHLRVAQRQVERRALLGGLLRARLGPHRAATSRSRSRRCSHESVELHLRSDVPVARLPLRRPRLELGRLAGLDLRRLPRCRAFTGRFPEDAAFDESRYAQALADARGLRPARARRHRRRRLPRARSATVIYHLDYPVAGPGLVPAVHGLAARGRSDVQGDPRRPGRRRDLRRLRPLPDRLLRAVHQGRDRRHDGRAATSSSPTSRSSPTSSALRNYKPLLQASSGARACSRSSTPATSRLINRAPQIGDEIDVAALGDYSPFETFQEIFNGDERRPRVLLRQDDPLRLQDPAAGAAAGRGPRLHGARARVAGAAARPPRWSSSRRRSPPTSSSRTAT